MNGRMITKCSQCTSWRYRIYMQGVCTDKKRKKDEEPRLASPIPDDVCPLRKWEG
jgi:hypothetical protein